MTKGRPEPALTTAQVPEILRRKLVFVSGKGGVGKTAVSQGIARALADAGLRTLWVCFEDPLQEPGAIRQHGPKLWYLNCSAELAFNEYASLKIGSGPLSKIFLKNKLVQYLAKAAPGIHELVLLGKVWYERTHYDRIVVDLPSTGHGLAMFQSTKNFSVLFTGGPVHRDAESMIETFGNPAESGHLILALPEEMPLQEALELSGFLHDLFPENPPGFLVNRLFPGVEQTRQSESEADQPDSWPTPLAKSAADYLHKRMILENYNLRLWRDRKIPFGVLEFVPPPDLSHSKESVSDVLSEELKRRGYL